MQALRSAEPSSTISVSRTTTRPPAPRAIKQSKGFSDENQFSAGINGQLTGRHSMGLTNVSFYESGAMFWDERADSVEDQALKPIQSPTEMGSTLSRGCHETQPDDVLPDVVPGRVRHSRSNSRSHRQIDGSVRAFDDLLQLEVRCLFERPGDAHACRASRRNALQQCRAMFGLPLDNGSSRRRSAQRRPRCRRLPDPVPATAASKHRR